MIDRRLASQADVRVGERLRILTTAGTAAFTVAGIAGTPHRQLLPEQAAIFFRSDVAARLAGSGSRVDLLGIITRRGADPDRVAKAVREQLHGSGLRVLTGSKRGEAESPDEALSNADIVAGLTVFALLATFVAIFVAASTFSLSVQQRHRELALLRAIGSTPAWLYPTKTHGKPVRIYVRPSSVATHTSGAAASARAPKAATARRITTANRAGKSAR